MGWSTAWTEDTETGYFSVSADLQPAADFTDAAWFSFTTFTATFHDIPLFSLLSPNANALFSEADPL